MGVFDFLKSKKNEEELKDDDMAAVNETESASSAPSEPDMPGDVRNMTPEQAAGQKAKQENLTPEQIAAQKAKQDELIKKRDEDGKVLAYLIDRHHEMKNTDSFKTALKSLMISWLWVPMRLQVSRADAEAMAAARKEGKKVSPKDPVKLSPALLTANDDQLVFAAFSNRDEIPKDIQNKFAWVQMPSGECGRQVVVNKNITALVINPNSKSLLLKRELLEKLIKPADPAAPKEGQESADAQEPTGHTS